MLLERARERDERDERERQEGERESARACESERAIERKGGRKASFRSSTMSYLHDNFFVVGSVTITDVSRDFQVLLSLSFSLFFFLSFFLSLSLFSSSLLSSSSFRMRFQLSQERRTPKERGIFFILLRVEKERGISTLTGWRRRRRLLRRRRRERREEKREKKREEREEERERERERESAIERREGDPVSLRDKEETRWCATTTSYPTGTSTNGGRETSSPGSTSQEEKSGEEKVSCSSSEET